MTEAGDPGARPRPIVLVVLDGFGIGRDPGADAIAAAAMPRWRSLLARWPHAVLQASEGAVGLPAGQMGNSEVGHLNLGAGRPVLQDLPRIDAAIADGSFDERPALLDACARAVETGRLHTVGLVGPGGVHANDRHLVALVRLAAARGVPSVRVHALLDGRDTPPSSGLGFVRDLEAQLEPAHPDARIATVGGRYWAMDRDQRWDRVERGYDAIVHGIGVHAVGATAAVEAAYARGETDEFVVPTVIDGVDGTVRDRDPIVHVNFRADRARQLTHALADPDVRRVRPLGPGRRGAAARPPGRHDDRVRGGPPGRGRLRSRGGAVAGAGVRRGRLDAVPRRRDREVRARHVLLQRRPRGAWPGEERRLVPSPRVATYDLQPEMSAARRDRRARRRDRVRPVRLHRRQLRQPGHGRPHGGVGRDDRPRWRRSTPASGGSPTPSSASRRPIPTAPAPPC